MATIPEELQVSNENAALIIPFQQERTESLNQHIHAVVSYTNPTTQLLFASPVSTHLPEAGLNPLVDCASYLFFLMGKMKRIKEHHYLARLQGELLTEVRNFQEKALTCRYHSVSLDEYVPIATYALCMALDDVISDTPWGGLGKWTPYNLVAHMFSEAASQKSFFIILERIIIEPDIYIDVVEFLYICLSFGMKCRNDEESHEFSYEQQGQISNFLYRFIQSYRGNVSRVLSPFPILPKQKVVPSKLTFGAILDAVSERSQSFIDKLKSLGGGSKMKDAAAEGDVQSRSLQRLRNRFNSAMNFIKKTRINKNGVNMGLDMLPWFLMIGSADSGKSSLLAKSNINFILGKKVDRPQKHPQPLIHSFDWWITQNAVLVDVPGAYIDDNARNAVINHEIWNEFLLMLSQSQKRKSLGGVVVAVSVNELIDRQQREGLIENLVNRIHEVQKLFGDDVPFYFSITKMDLLPGFLDFFSDCAAEELTQAWGVTMPPSSAEFVTSTFIKRFNALIRILNNQIIQRLHFERDQYVRSYIKDFPLYVEKIKDEFAAMLNAFKSNHASFNLKGVYLTSAMQNSKIHCETLHPETMSAARGSEKLLEIMSTPDVKQAPYFIKQFILYGIMQ